MPLHSSNADMKKDQESSGFRLQQVILQGLIFQVLMIGTNRGRANNKSARGTSYVITFSTTTRKQIERV